MLFRRVLPFLALLPSLACQDDLRDVVRLANGKELRGRIVDPHAPAELLLAQGGKRIRVDRTQIVASELVGDRVREFLDRRLSLRSSVNGQWILVEWAQANGLPGLARVQATDLALRSDDERAHTFLGHRKKGAQWLWPHDGRWLSREDLDGALGKAPMVLRGERFELRCDGSLATNVAALLDLERLGDWMHATLGADLQLRENLQPVRVATWRNGAAFPKWGFRPSPYYVPDPHGDEARAFFILPDRPYKLFLVGAHALLYHGMIGSVDPRDERDRVCAWLELGLASYAEASLGGDPGFATAFPQPGLEISALQAEARSFKLVNLLHLPMYTGFYQVDNAETDTWWHVAAMFTRFLLDPATPAQRTAFFAFARKSLIERKGDSSSVFDAAMGKRVEELEAPFRTWLRKLAGN
jgi:hypothetical protein